MFSLKEKIAKVIPENLFFIDLVENKAQSRIKIIIDGMDSIDLQTTTSIARYIRNSEIVSSEYPDGVQIEVTSPGIDAPLVHPFQFKKNINRSLNVKTFDKIEPFLIKLTNVFKDSFEGTLVSGVKSRYKFEEIESATIQIKF
jgi:ribosome maturation factor RimP|tara:strand:- start:457 stop:885 length:429 start_codon:yes stop_codon:yes gene_type:complete